LQRRKSCLNLWNKRRLPAPRIAIRWLNLLVFAAPGPPQTQRGRGATENSNYLAQRRKGRKGRKITVKNSPR
jgi:hypothetical protein